MRTNHSEFELSEGGIVAVNRTREGVTRSVTVPPKAYGFYKLLSQILSNTDSAGITPVFIADLANEYNTLPAAERGLKEIEKGSVTLNGCRYGISITRPAATQIEDYRNSKPIHLAAVGCSGSKFDDTEPLPARERYKGSYWQNKRKYGEYVADQMKIISAEHDVLDPDTQIEYYERTPDDWEGVSIESSARLPAGSQAETKLDQWALNVYEGLNEWINSEAGQWAENNIHLDILLGKAYLQPLEERGVFDALTTQSELSIRYPFQEVDEAQGGLFEQIGWMADQIEDAKTDATSSEQTTF